MRKRIKQAVKKLLKRHRITHIIKLPEKTFDGINTSIFVFEAGKPQNDSKIFGCYVKEDGLNTIKNQGRQDVFGRWKSIEDYWIKVINHEINDATVKYIDPKDSLSYTEQKDIRIYRSIFNTVLIELQFYRNMIDFTTFCENFTKAMIYQADFPEEHSGYFHKILSLSKEYKGDSLINTTTWQDFRLSDILCQTGRGQRLRKQDRQHGDVPLATAGYVNQGISNFIGNNEQYIHPASITIDMFCNCFLREYPFACDDNVYVFQTKERLSIYAKLFIVSVINVYSQRFCNIYNYDNQFREHIYTKETIKLPADSDGNPDWQFMEDYIKSLPYSKGIE